VSAEVELRMLEGSEFQTVGAAMLKPREAKVVQTTDKRLDLHRSLCRSTVKKTKTRNLGQSPTSGRPVPYVPVGEKFRKLAFPS